MLSCTRGSCVKGRKVVRKAAHEEELIRVGKQYGTQSCTCGRSNQGRKVVSEAAHEEGEIRVGKK